MRDQNSMCKTVLLLWLAVLLLVCGLKGPFYLLVQKSAVYLFVDAVPGPFTQSDDKKNPVFASK